MKKEEMCKILSEAIHQFSIDGEFDEEKDKGFKPKVHQCKLVSHKEAFGYGYKNKKGKDVEILDVTINYPATRSALGYYIGGEYEFEDTVDKFDNEEIKRLPINPHPYPFSTIISRAFIEGPSVKMRYLIRVEKGIIT